MTVLQNTIVEPDGAPLDGYLMVEVVGNPFRQDAEAEVLGAILNRAIAGGSWSVDLAPGLYRVTQRRLDGTFHSVWGVDVPESTDPVWLADVVTEVPGVVASVPLLGVVGATVDVAGHLILTLTDDSTVDAGFVVGPEGPAGPEDAGAKVTVPAATGVAATDTANMDAALAQAVAEGKPLIVPAGEYHRTSTWDLRHHNLTVLGAGPQRTIIVPPDNTTGVRLGLWYQHVEGLGVRYASQQPAASTGAIGFALAQCAWGVYRRLSVEFAAAGFDTPQTNFSDGFWSDGNYGAFSCTFADLFIGGFAITGFRLKAFNGAVSGSGAFTQNLIENVYMKNNHSGSVANSIDSGFILDNGNGSTVNNLNVEHSDFDSSHAVLLQTVDTVVINGLHCEGVEPVWFQGAVIGVYGDGNVTVNALNVVLSRFEGTGGDVKSIVAAGVGAKVLVNGLQVRDNTITGAGLAMFRNHDFGAGGAASARFLNGDGPGAPFTQLSLGDTGLVPLLKQVNDVVYASKNAAGKHVLYGTAAPTTGTWAVGDTVWNTAPAAGGAPGWVCTTAGTPGTWKAMASLAA